MAMLPGDSSMIFAVTSGFSILVLAVLVLMRKTLA